MEGHSPAPLPPSTSVTHGDKRSADVEAASSYASDVAHEKVRRSSSILGNYLVQSVPR